MTRKCGEDSTISRKRFIGSFFDGGLVDEHNRNIVTDGIDALAFNALQCVSIRFEFNLRFACRTREYFQEFLTNCHGLDLSAALLAGMRQAYHKDRSRRQEQAQDLNPSTDFTDYFLRNLRTACQDDLYCF